MTISAGILYLAWIYSISPTLILAEFIFLRLAPLMHLKLVILYLYKEEFDYLSLL